MIRYRCRWLAVHLKARRQRRGKAMQALQNIKDTCRVRLSRLPQLPLRLQSQTRVRPPADAARAAARRTGAHASS